RVLSRSEALEAVQRIANFVRQRGRHLADRRERLALLHALLEAARLGAVLEEIDGAERAALGVAHVGALAMQHERASVGGGDLDLAFFAVQEGRAARAAHVVQRASDAPLGRRAEDALRGGARTRD